MRLPPLAALCVAPLLLNACGGDGKNDATTPTNPTGPTVTASTTYSGVFSTGIERGTITLVTGTPATGSLTLEDGAPVSLTGTFTAATSTFSLSGGGFTVNATALAQASGSVADDTGVSARVSGVRGSYGSASSSAAASTLSGSVTGPGLTGTGTLAATASTAAVTGTHYCGVYTGDDSGMGDVFIAGSSAVATMAGMGGGFPMSGAVNGSAVTLKVTGGSPVNTVTASLGISGTSLSGPLTSTLYPNDRVTFRSTSTACGSTQPTGPYTSYVGWVAANGIAERLTLIPGTPATGTLEWIPPFAGSGKLVYPLSGTFNPSTGTFTVSYTPTVPGGGAVTIVATAVGPVLTGTAQGGLLQSVGLLAGVGALGSSASLPVQRYCGNIYGGTTQAPTSWNGVMTFAYAGSRMLGVATWRVPIGLALPLTGKTGGSWAYLNSGTSLFVAGDLTTFNASGTWSHVNNAKGTYTMSLC